MTLFHDFESEPPPTPETSETSPIAAPEADDHSPAAPAPRVVVQYRGRSRIAWVVPPVAVAASLITWVAVDQRGRREAPAPAPIRPAARSPEPAPPPVVLKVAALPAPEKPPEPVIELPPPAVPAPPPAPTEPPRVVEAPRAPDPAADTQQALAAIRDEAEKAQQARTEMARLRAALPAIEARQQAEARRIAEAQRSEFHRQLQTLVRSKDAGTARDIWALVVRADIPPDPAVEQAIRNDLEKRGPGLDRAKRISLFRRHGLPEPLILAELIREQRLLMPSRKGPRTVEEAILRATRQLLAEPPRSAESARTAAAAMPPGQPG